VSAETTFARDVADGTRLRRTLLDLSEHVGRRLRASEMAATTIRLKLRWPDFITLSRQTTLPQPTDLDDEIYRNALGLFEAVWKPGRAVRLLGVAGAGLAAPVRQLSLWETGGPERAERLAETLDAIRDKYGHKAVRRASLTDRGRGD
jgi:DNA polymerase-4